MNMLSLAARNVFRNKRRTFLTFMSIITAATAIVVFGGFIRFSFEGLRESTIRNQLGHFQIARHGYFAQGAGLSVDFLIDDPAQLEQELTRSSQVKAVTRRLSGAGLASSGEKTLSVRLIGVMPEREEEFSSFETVIAGTQLDKDTADGCVLGQGLAKGLGASEGASISVLSTTLDGVINALDCRVTGIVRTASREYDNVYLKLPLPLLQKLFNTSKVEKLLVLGESTDQMDGLEQVIKAAIGRFAQLEHKSWIELAEFYKGVVNLYTTLFRLAAIVLGGVVFLSITNAMSMSTFERFREIGTLRAIGSSRARIVRMFVLEGVLIGVIGGAVGLLAGIGVAKLINLLGGIAVPPPPGMSSGYIAFIPLDPAAMLSAFGVALVASTLSSFYPAFLAARLDIVDALHHS